MLGLGGGFLAVPALAGVVGLRMKAAVGARLPVVIVNSIAAPATRSHPADGLDWGVIAPFTGAAILGADGKRLATKVSGDRLRQVFACVLAVAAFMLLDGLVRPGRGRGRCPSPAEPLVPPRLPNANEPPPQGPDRVTQGADVSLSCHRASGRGAKIRPAHRPTRGTACGGAM